MIVIRAQELPTVRARVPRPREDRHLAVAHQADVDCRAGERDIGRRTGQRQEADPRAVGRDGEDVVGPGELVGELLERGLAGGLRLADRSLQRALSC